MMGQILDIDPLLRMQVRVCSLQKPSVLLKVLCQFSQIERSQPCFLQTNDVGVLLCDLVNENVHVGVRPLHVECEDFQLASGLLNFLLL